MSIHRAEGTNCVVYSPVEGTYIPALEMDQSIRDAKVLLIEENTPRFRTLGEAWAWHVQFAQQSIETRHTQIEAEYGPALDALKKKVSSLHVAKVIDGIFNG